MGIEWKTPPSNAGPHRKWAGIADELRARLNVWALVASGASLSYSTVLRGGASPGWTRGEFEVRTVGTATDRTHGDIYARYVGGAK